MRVNLGKLSFNVRVYAETARRYLLCAVAVLCALCLAAGSVCLALELQFIRYTVEAGHSVSAAEIAGDESATFGADHDPDIFNRAGVHYVSVYTSRGIQRVRLKVKDTKAPEVTLKDVYFAAGASAPTPMDFIDTVYEPDSFYGEFLTEMPDLTRIGSHVMRVRFTDASGNETQIFEVRMTQIYDRTAPIIEAPEVITVRVGETIDYSQYVSVSDNCIGALTYTVDDSALDLETEDEYEIYVTATDAAGNKSKQKITVEVVEDIEQ